MQQACHQKEFPRSAVVIGGGIGGLSVASILAKEGVETVIIEKNESLGGMAGGFYRGGIHFQLGCNVSGPVSKGGILLRFLDYFGITQRTGIQKLDENGCIRIVSTSGEILIPAGIKNLEDFLTSLYPNDKTTIINFFQNIQKITTSLTGLNISKTINDSSLAEKEVILLTKPVEESLNEVKNPVVKEILSLFWRFTGTPPELLPMSLYAPVFTSFVEGPCFLDGRKLVRAIEEKFLSWGGKKVVLSEVDKIIANTDRIEGVKTSNGEFYPADTVISTLHPAITYKLINNEECNKIQRRIARAGETSGVFVAYFKAKTPKLEENRWTILTNDGKKKQFDLTTDKSFDDTGICIFCSRMEKNDEVMIRAHLFVPFELFDAWKNSISGRRGKEYEEMKDKMASNIAEKIKKAFPREFENLTCIDKVTTLTIRDYLGNPGGAFGILRSARRLGLATCGWKTPVKGLWQGGQSALYPGVVGTIETSFLIAGEIFGKNYHRDFFN